MSSTDMIKFLEEIEKPSEEFSMIPFWFLNDRLSKQKIRCQLKDFKRKGIDIVVVHPRIGLPKRIKYLSEKFFKYYAYILKTAKEVDLKIIIYDDGMYPSGSAGGLVVKGHPQLKSLGLYLSCEPKGKIIERLDDGKYLVEKYSEGRIRGLHYGEDDGEINQPYSADILNGEAVDRFIELTHEQYYKRFKDYFGTVIIGFFTDEPQALGRGKHICCVWTKDLDKKIVERGGDLKELASLFNNTENKTTKIYHEILQEIEINVYYKKLKDFCNTHGVLLVGHPAECDDIEKLKNFDIPGQDLVFRSVAIEKGDCDGRDSVLGKCSSDYARCAGKKRNANECLGVCGKEGNPWELSPEDIKWYFDYLAVRGVNMFIPHAFYYSLRGKRKEERPPDVGLNTLYWKYYNRFSTYVKRLSWLMTNAVNLAKVMVICKNANIPYEEVKYFYQNQIEFNYVPVSFLNNCERDQGIRLGENLYTYIYDKNGLSEGRFFEEALYINKASEVKDKEIYFKNPQKNIRCSHFIKQGKECFLLVNSGNEKVCDNVKIKGIHDIVRYDLWNGEYGKLFCSYTEQETEFILSLERNESVLLILDETVDNIPVYQTKKKIVPLCFKFVKENKRTLEKKYVAYIDGEAGQDNKYVQICAEEFVKWYVNGKFVDVTFWNPHTLAISKYLKTGKNVVVARVVGSVANRYGKKKVPYGIRQEEKEY